MMIIIRHLHKRRAELFKKKILRIKGQVLVSEIVVFKDSRKII